MAASEGTVRYLTDAELAAVIDNIENIKKNCESFSKKWKAATKTGAGDSFDSRILNYKPDDYDLQDNDAINNLKSYINNFHIFEDYLIDKQEKVRELNGRYGSGGIAGVSTPAAAPVTPATTPSADGDHTIPIDAFEGLTGQEKEDLVDFLTSLGFTEEEINDFKEGKWKVNKTTLDKLSTEFASIKNNYPNFYNNLIGILGFDILNADGTVNQDRLAIAMAISGHTLGMDINLESGSAFRTLMDSYKIKLEAAYKIDPSIRQQFIDKYGIDVFNADGTVDLERLALAKMMDGLNPNEYNMESLIPNTQTTELTDYPGTPATKPLYIDGPSTPSPTTPNNPTDPANPTTPATGSSVGSDIIGGTGTNGGNSYGSIGASDGKALASATASAKDGLGLAGSKLLGAIGAGAKGISKKIINNSAVKLATSKIATNKASVGIIAAVGLAAGGTLAGGGIALSQKLRYIKFTPENWLALPEDTQATIEKLMVKVGFDEEELETFKNSCFKIRADELKNHTKKIEKTAKNSTDSEESLIGQYKYSIIDENGKADNYLTFITMIIDGKNSADEYNMYSILNQHLEDDKESDFIYMGINMEDYIDEEDDIDNIIEIDDPSIQKLDDEVIESDNSNDSLFEEGIDEEESGFKSDSDDKSLNEEEKIDFSKLVDGPKESSDEAGFGQDAIGGSFELADDSKDNPNTMSGQISEKEWLKSIGIDN